MRFFLLSIYSSFFIAILGSPIDSAPNDLSLDDSVTNLDLEETQATSQPNIDLEYTQTPSQPNTAIPVAFNNVDSTDSDVTESQTPLDSGSGTSVATIDADPTINTDLDQLGSTYIATNEQISTPSVHSSWVAQKPQMDLCKTKKQSGDKNTPTCVISGIDFNSFLDDWGPAALFGLIGFLVSFTVKYTKGFIEFKRKKDLKLREAIEEYDKQYKTRKPNRKPTKADKVADKKMQEALDEYYGPGKVTVGSGEQTAENGNGGDDSKPSAFRQAFISADQTQLHQGVETGLIGLGLVGAGFVAAHAADLVVSYLITAGPEVLLLLLI